MNINESESEVVSDPQQPRGLQPTRLLHPWDFPGKSTGVGCHCLLQLEVLGPMNSLCGTATEENIFKEAKKTNSVQLEVEYSRTCYN